MGDSYKKKSLALVNSPSHLPLKKVDKKEEKKSQSETKLMLLALQKRICTPKVYKIMKCIFECKKLLWTANIIALEQKLG